MASPQLLITNGTETVSWDGTDAWLMATQPFVPSTPALKTNIMAQPGLDGAEQITADYDNVAETIGVSKFIGGVATVRANIQKLTRLLNQARNYNRPGVLPVYVKFRPDSSEAWYRSQLLSGRALWDNHMLDYMWPVGEFDVTVIFTRRYYWEADAEAEIPLSIATGVASYATGGVTLRDHEDATAGHTNGAEINGGVLAGDLAAPPRLELKNTAGGTYGAIFVAHEVETVGPVTPALEGEASLPLSNQADALSASGNFNRITWTSAAETDLLTWSTQLTAAQLANMAGRFFRVLIRFATAPVYTDLWLRLKLTNAAGTILQTPKLLMKSSGLQLQELGTVQLPPHLMNNTVLATLSLVLQATRTSGAAATLDVDFIQLLALDGWRKYVPAFGGIAVNDTLLDDMLAVPPTLTTLLAAATAQKNYTVQGAPIMLQPGLAKQRLRVLWMRTTGLATVDDTLSLKVFYRPRRLTI